MGVLRRHFGNLDTTKAYVSETRIFVFTDIRFAVVGEAVQIAWRGVEDVAPCQI